MEPVSTVAGITSVGIKVFSGALEIQQFVSQMQDAGNDIKQAAAEMTALSRVLSSVDLPERDQDGPLHECIAKLQDLENSIESLQSKINAGNAFTRLQASFRHVRKSDSLKKLKELLGNAKTTLLIAMVQRNNYFSQDLQNSATIDRRLEARHFRILHERGVSLAQQGAANHETVLSRLNKLRRRLQSCSVSTTAKWSEIGGTHWDELSAEVARMVRKIDDDILRTNLQHIINESMKEHFDAVLVPSRTPKLMANDSTPRKDFLSQPAFLPSRSPKMFESWKKCFFGNIFLISEVQRDSDSAGSSVESQRNEWVITVRSTYIFHPSLFTILRGMRSGLKIQIQRRASQGWKHTLRGFNAVPNDALVFELCREGNMQAVQQLFSIGEASPWDIDQDGWTPLHHAAFHHHQDLCRLLLDSGSDSSAMTYPKSDQMSSTPFDNSFFGTFWLDENDPSLFDFFRWSSDTADMSFIVKMSRVNRATWSQVLLENHYGSSLNFRSFNHTLLWILRNCLQDESQDPENRWSVMGWILYAVASVVGPHEVEHGMTVLRDFLSVANLKINGSMTIDGRMLIHVVLSGDIYVSEELIHILLAAGADPHLESQEPKPQNPTQIALRCGDIFWIWRKALTEYGYYLEDFVEESLHVSNWTGWTKNTLSQIFYLEFGIIFTTTYTHAHLCWICGGGWFESRCLWWSKVIDQIQSGSDESVANSYSFNGVLGDSGAFAVEVQDTLLGNSSSPKVPHDELAIYKSIWSHPAYLRSTCIGCLAKVRDFVQRGAAADVSASDVLETLRAAIRPNDVNIDSESKYKHRNMDARKLMET